MRWKHRDVLTTVHRGSAHRVACVCDPRVLQAAFLEQLNATLLDDQEGWPARVRYGLATLVPVVARACGCDHEPDAWWWTVGYRYQHGRAQVERVMALRDKTSKEQKVKLANMQKQVCMS